MKLEVMTRKQIIKEAGETENVRYCITVGWANGEWRCTWFEENEPWENYQFFDRGRAGYSSANRHVFLIDKKNKKIYCIECPNKDGIEEVESFATGYRKSFTFKN
jgi:hypothetical protein